MHTSSSAKDEAAVRPMSLVSLLEQQQAMYGILHDLGVQQRELIARNENESLLSLLGRRQEVIDQLARVSGKLQLFREDWTGSCERLSAEDRVRVDDLVNENRETLTTIMAMDREDSDLLARKKGRVGAELSTVPTHRQVNAAYGVSTAPSSRYVDRTDDQA